MRAYDADPSVEDAVREARTGNAFLLMRHLEWRVDPAVVELLRDVFEERMKPRPIVWPTDETLTKAEVEAAMDRFRRRLRAKDRETIDWIRTNKLPETRPVETAEHFAAAFFGVTKRTIEEIRHPQPGRGKRRTIRR